MLLKKLVLASLAALSLNAVASTQEFIINGTFHDNPNQSTQVQTGWTVNSNAHYFNGNVYFEGAVNSTGSLSQTVLGAHGVAVLSFDFLATSGYQSVVWDGVTLGTVNAPSPLTHYSYNVTATGHDTLTFLGQNNPSYNRLSNVSLLATVGAVPEPETYGMLLAGLGMVGFMARRRKAA